MKGIYPRKTPEERVVPQPDGPVRRNTLFQPRGIKNYRLTEEVK